MRVLIVAVLVASLAACATVPASSTVSIESVTTVEFDGTWIVYRGDFSESANREARRLFASHRDAAGVKITSNGGSVDWGMALGEWLLVTGRDVYIEGHCFSSCANYVFPAGRRKILASDAVLGWHGGTRQWPDAKAMCAGAGLVLSDAQLANCIEHAQQTRDREARFYGLLGVDPEIMVYGLRPGANYPAQASDTSWTYTLEDMSRFGIRNISVDGDPWQPRYELDGQTLCRMDLDLGRCISVAEP